MTNELPDMQKSREKRRISVYRPIKLKRVPREQLRHSACVICLVLVADDIWSCRTRRQPATSTAVDDRNTDSIESPQQINCGRAGEQGRGGFRILECGQLWHNFKCGDTYRAHFTLS